MLGGPCQQCVSTSSKQSDPLTVPLLSSTSASTTILSATSTRPQHGPLQPPPCEEHQNPHRSNQHYRRGAWTSRVAGSMIGRWSLDSTRRSGRGCTYSHFSTRILLSRYCSSHHVWLRDHCRCPECFHPITKQRLLNTFDVRRFPSPCSPYSYLVKISPDITPTSVESKPDGLEVQCTETISGSLGELLAHY